MTRFHSSFTSCSPLAAPKLAVLVHNLLLKRELPKEREQHALRDAAANVPVRIRYRGHVGAHLPVRKSTSQSGAGVASMAWTRFVHCAARIMRRHIDICRPAWALA